MEFVVVEHETVLDWPTCLTALQHFRAQVDVDQLILPPCLSCMVNLTTLSVFSVGERAPSYIVPALDWSRLVLLEAVELWGAVECPARSALSDILTLPKLSMVILAFSFSPSVQATSELALLSQSFKQERPDIEYSTTPTCWSCFDSELFEERFQFEV